MYISDPKRIKISEKKEEKIILLDMDGVLSCFNKAICDLLDIDIEDKKIRDMLKAGKYLDDTDLTTPEKLWGAVNDKGLEFWSEMEIYPYAKKLYNEMKKIGTVGFLTSPGSCVFAGTGKMQWIKKHFGEDGLVTMIIGKNKHYCAQPGVILVDDHKKNVNKFKDAGGKGFVWPSGLNFIDGDKDVDKVIEELIKYIRS